MDEWTDMTAEAEPARDTGAAALDGVGSDDSAAERANDSG
jgi:hypothetical protein